MRNIKLITLFTLLISIQLFSQENKSKKLNFGINLGANLLDLNQNDHFDTYNGIISYSFGISVEYKISKKLSLLSGLNYDRKVMKLEDLREFDINGNSFTIDNRLKFTYINIPILVRYYIGNNNNFFVNGGGFYNHPLNIKDDTKIKETGESTTLYENENIIHDYDYGVSLGIGYNFDLNDKNYFSVELKNEFGLANIANHPNTSLTDLKTNTIKLILNWELPI